MNFKKLYTRIVQIFKLLLNVIYMILVFLSLIILFGFGVDKLITGKGDVFSYRPIVIKTGSMHPTIYENSIIIGKRIKNIEELNTNDIITYQDNDKLVTHRITEIDYETGFIKTKGDNNDQVDYYHDERGLNYKYVEYRIDYIFNQVAPFLNIIFNYPHRLVYLGLILFGIYIIYKTLNDLYYREVYEFKLKEMEGR